MNRHVEDLINVGYVNGVATAISISDIEAKLRIASLVIAIVYTFVKLWQALKQK